MSPNRSRADITAILNSDGELESMVPIRRSSVYHRGFGHGVGHDTRTRLPIFRPCTEKVGTQYDLGLYGLFHYRHIPMVLLGLLAGLLSHGNKRIHWRPSTFRPHEHTRCAKSWLSPDPGAPIQLLSGMHIIFSIALIPAYTLCRCNLLPRLAPSSSEPLLSAAA